MSGTETDPPDGATLAAEYVLGTLDLAEAQTAQARLATDRAFAAEVVFWEARLYPLTELAAPVEPPFALWARIEDTVGSGSPGRAIGAKPANDNRRFPWRGVAIASWAVAASLAAFILLRPAEPPAFAVLAPTGSTTPVLVGFAGPDGGIDLRPSGVISVLPTRDLQLWSLAAGTTRPVSLGLLPTGGKQLPPGVAPGTQLLVSLEPKGGSPTGQPTGPVVYGGVLRRFQ